MLRRDAGKKKGQRSFAAAGREMRNIMGSAYVAVITKEFLKEYAGLLDEIECEEARYEKMRSGMNGSPGAFDDMPKGHHAKDGMATRVCIMFDLEKKLNGMRKQEHEIRDFIEREILSNLKDPQERAVIRMRYIDRMEWIEIRRTLFSKRGDYYRKEEKYKRITFRIHRNALENLKKMENLKNFGVNRSKSE